MMHMVEIDTSAVCCPLFLCVSGAGFLCGGGITGQLVSVQADETLDLMKHIEYRCSTRFDDCPVYRKIASMSMLYCETAHREGGKT